MIVIAIIGIITTVAVPQYGKYTKRSKFSEVIIFTAERKSAVSICVQENNSLDSCDGDNSQGRDRGIPDDVSSGAGKYLASIFTENGRITATGNDAVDGATYILQPAVQDSSVTWTRSGTCVEMNLCK